MTEPDLNLLIALDMLLAHGSVAEAARRLHLSASAMSRTLTRLREQTGDALLVRAGRGMVLTPHAEGLRERARQAANEARDVLRPSPASFDPAGLQRTFSIRANDGFIEGFGARLIAAMNARAPRVRLRFLPKGEKSAGPLREGLADLEVGVLGNMGPEVRVQALFRDHFIAAVAHDHPLADGEAVTPARYAAASHVVASRHGKITGPVDDALRTLGLERYVAAVVPTFAAAIAIARDTALAALVPASFIASVPPETRSALHVFALPVSVPGIIVSHMWHPRSDADPAHRWLRQQMLATCRPSDNEV